MDNQGNSLLRLAVGNIMPFIKGTGRGIARKCSLFYLRAEQFTDLISHAAKARELRSGRD